MITWITDRELGTIVNNTAIDIDLIAESSEPNDAIFYTLTSGQLPAGVELLLSGKLTGRSQQSILTLDCGTTLFDQNTTSFDNTFTITVRAQGITSLHASEKEFTIAVLPVFYKNVYIKAFLAPEKRELWNEFITNTHIFTPTAIYKPITACNDTREELTMLLFAGIEPTIAEKYISLTGPNFRKKQLYFGDIAVAEARLPGSRTVEYQVIYVKVQDPLEKDSITLPDRITHSAIPHPQITADIDNSIFYTRDQELLSTQIPFVKKSKAPVLADSTEFIASDSNIVVSYPSSIRIWRKQILLWREDSDIDPENDGFLTERNNLPLWMRTSQFQDDQPQELGYVPAIVLCYCVPGTAHKIVENIRNYMSDTGFEFNQFDFTVDRLIIDNYTFFKS